MLNWFNKKKIIQPDLRIDLHSHLLPGLDDGVKTFEEAFEIISFLKSLGYQKLIITPHIMSDLYRNDENTINEKLVELKKYLAERDLSIALEVGAEYYLDEVLMAKLTNNEPLITFGDRYLLFETGFMTEPLHLKQFIFLAASKGYKLILAHPERYQYLHQDFVKAEDLLNRGVLFQVNISSITGYYSKQAQSMAYQLINRGWVHFLASDCHHLMHAQLIKKAYGDKYFQKALHLPLLNNTL